MFFSAKRFGSIPWTLPFQTPGQKDAFPWPPQQLLSVTANAEWAAVDRDDNSTSSTMPNDHSTDTITSSKMTFPWTKAYNIAEIIDLLRDVSHFDDKVRPIPAMIDRFVPF